MTTRAPPDLGRDANPPPGHPPGLPPVAGPSRRRRAGLGLLVAAAVVAGTVLVSDLAGWFYLSAPIERWMASRLQRPVYFGPAGTSGLRLHLIVGGPHLTLDHVALSAPTSPSAPIATLHQLTATQVEVTARWRDLLAAWRGEGWAVGSIRADTLSMDVRRDAPTGGPADGARGDPAPPWRVGRLAVRDGSLRLVDAAQTLEVDVDFGGRLGGNVLAGDDDPDPPGFTARAEGRYGDAPLRAEASIATPAGGVASSGGAWPARLKAQAGRAALSFDGQWMPQDDGRWQVEGAYDLRGPSLAAVGAPLGVTLPASPPFTMQGKVAVNDQRWHVQVTQARLGASRLAGVFDHARPAAGARPRLTGRLTGARLALPDLAPSIGLAAAGTRRHADGRVLPDRPFDLPSLRAMDADVQIVLDSFDAGTERLRDVRPLHARLRLEDGVLTLDALDARLAGGRVTGLLQLDGRDAVARWKADLQLRGVQIEQWIAQPRAGSALPYLSGRLGASLSLTGQGRSTAQLLATADGRASLWMRDGALSHLAIEAMGIDLAQALGVALRGDAALPVTCGAADLTVRDGVVRPRVAVIDTRDSTLVVDGSLSLATERMALVARVAPKDATPLALRSPVHVDGLFADPEVSVEATPLLKRLLPAALLATLHPLAALLPLFDPGDDDARAAVDACRAALSRTEPRARGAG